MYSLTVQSLVPSVFSPSTPSQTSALCVFIQTSRITFLFSHHPFCVSYPVLLSYSFYRILGSPVEAHMSPPYPNPHHIQCPTHYIWYACPKFIGCCHEEQESISHPCETECRAGNLSPAAFPPGNYGKFPDPSCPLGAAAYTCNIPAGPSTNLTFWGCCKTGASPCNPDGEGGLRGCGRGELVGALLTTESQMKAYGVKPESESSMPSPPSPISTVDQSSMETATVNDFGSSTALATVTASVSPPPSSSKSVNPGIIAGSAVGGLLGLVLLGILIALYIRHTRRSRKGHGVHAGDGNDPSAHPGMQTPHSPAYPGQGEKSQLSPQDWTQRHSHGSPVSPYASGMTSPQGYAEMDGSTIHEMESPSFPGQAWGQTKEGHLKPGHGSTPAYGSTPGYGNGAGTGTGTGTERWSAPA